MSNPVVYFEVLGQEGKQLQTFYQDLFGWKTTEIPGMNYATVEPEEGGIAGGIGEPGSGDEVKKMVTFYVDVENLQEKIDQAVSLGGKKVMDPMDLPNNYGSIALFADPEGNVIGLWCKAKA